MSFNPQTPHTQPLTHPHRTINTLKYIENTLKIRTKDGRIADFHPNKAQLKLYDIIRANYNKNKPIFIIILKARQLGFSTFTGGVLFKLTATHKFVDTAIIAHTSEASTNLFNMYKLFYESLPHSLQPTIKASNAKELFFDNQDGTGLKSRIRCLTAGSKGMGRSLTLNYMHLSELAFWEGDVQETLTGLMQAFTAKPNSICIIESTPNGYDKFKEMWDDAVNGDSDFIPLFVGWNENEEYSTPYTGFELTPEEEELRSTYNLTLDQLEWRRRTIRNKCNNDIDQFHQEYPICPEEAFLASGRCAFDQTKIVERQKNVTDPIKRGRFEYELDEESTKITNWWWVDDPRGPIRIWREPEKDRPYVLGGDTAGDGSDEFTADVLDNVTCEQVATYENLVDETLYARQMYCLGHYYNEALVGIECNFSTYPIKELVRIGYPNMYVREIEDTYTGSHNKAFGFRTSVKTKPVLVGRLKDLVREHVECINDRKTLNEMLTFVKDENDKYGAQEGKHDDKVMSLGIALSIRTQQSTYVEEDKKYIRLMGEDLKKNFKWEQDLIDDYYRASDEVKERMIEKYGEIR